MNDGVGKFYPDQTCALTFTCQCDERHPANFYLVLKLINASISFQTEQPYLIIDESTVKIPFSLHANATSAKTVFLVINQNAGSFQYFVSLEPHDSKIYFAAPISIMQSYDWNATANCYDRGAGAMCQE